MFDPIGEPQPKASGIEPVSILNYKGTVEAEGDMKHIGDQSENGEENQTPDDEARMPPADRLEQPGQKP